MTQSRRALVMMGLLLMPVVALAAGDEYRTFFGISPRMAIWVIAELHLMFGAFVLGVPIFAVVVEFVGLKSGDKRYDALAYEFTKLLSAAFATTAAFGGLMAFAMVGLYPRVSNHLAGVFSPSYFFYALLFFGEGFTLYFYYYGWKWLSSTAIRKPRLAKAAWYGVGVITLAVLAIFFFGKPDYHSMDASGEADAARIERFGEALGPWLKQGIEDEEDLEEYIGGAAGELATYEVGQVTAGTLPGTPEDVQRIRDQVLTSTLEIGGERKITGEDAVSRLETEVELMAATAIADWGVVQANASEGWWRLMAWVFMGGMALSCFASWATSDKVWHLYFGVLLNLVGTVILLIANSWATYMMSPAGINTASLEFVGTTWQATTNALWHPVNIHRLLANVVLGGFVAGAYAAVRFMGATTDEERAHYDWMGYVGNFVGMCAMIPLPFAGYYLGREVYSYSPIMGNNMMGGAFSWTFILQALLIGMLFLGANYYLWVGMERIEGAERYRKYVPWNTVILIVCFMIWLTPHNLPLSGTERALMAGESFHPVLKYFGLMPAKNAVVNFIIVSTFFSFLMYRRGNLGEAPAFSKSGTGGKLFLVTTLAACLGVLGGYAYSIIGLDPASMSVVPENRWIFLGTAGALGVQCAAAVVVTVMTFMNRGRVGQGLYFTSTVLLVTGFLGVWGFVAMTDASQFLRNIAVSQVLMVLTCLVLNSTIDVLIFRDAETVGEIRWGHIGDRAQYALILVCTSVVMLMGLMGFIRSGLREDWHVYGVLRDTSEWAFTPTQATMTLTVSCITFVFLSMVAFVFWLANLVDRTPAGEVVGIHAPDGDASDGVSTDERLVPAEAK